MDLEDSEDGICNEIIKNEEQLEVVESKDTQDYQVNGEEAVQIQPQRVKLKLVKGKTIRRFDWKLVSAVKTSKQFFVKVRVKLFVDINPLWIQ